MKTNQLSPVCIYIPQLINPLTPLEGRKPDSPSCLSKPSSYAVAPDDDLGMEIHFVMSSSCTREEFFFNCLTLIIVIFTISLPTAGSKAHIEQSPMWSWIDIYRDELMGLYLTT